MITQSFFPTPSIRIQAKCKYENSELKNLRLSDINVLSEFMVTLRFLPLQLRVFGLDVVKIRKLGVSYKSPRDFISQFSDFTFRGDSKTQSRGNSESS